MPLKERSKRVGSSWSRFSRESLGAVWPVALALICAKVKGTALGLPWGARASIHGPPG